jgi:hypothetical protein
VTVDANLTSSNLTADWLSSTWRIILDQLAKESFMEPENLL